MNISQEKIDNSTRDVLEIFVKNDVQYIESIFICLNLCAMAAQDSQFPFEKFKRMINEQINDYKEEWPIG